MISPVILSIPHPDGSNWNVIIEPILEKVEGQITDTGNYKLYKSSADNQSTLFTEPLELGKQNNDIPDSINPDYLGTITLRTGAQYTYDGSLLHTSQLDDVVRHIRKQE